MSGLKKYPVVDKNDKAYKSKYTHCCHCLIFSKTDKIIHGCVQKAIILMEVRFDGYLGFPGGLINKSESRTHGLNRELGEELNWHSKSFKDGPVKEKHYISTHFDKLKSLVLHFYAIEVSEQQIIEIEKNYLSAKDHGNETYGLVRVPLYTLEDGYRGLPAFLDNNFIGNAKYLLLQFLKEKEFLSETDIQPFLISPTE